MKQKLKEMQGFTLAELLIVVAIIGVLVAISIPVFNTQLERSRESTDLANLRAAYAECAAEALIMDTNVYTSVSKTVKPVQTEAGWGKDKAEKDDEDNSSVPEIGGEKAPTITKEAEIVVYVTSDGELSFLSSNDSKIADKSNHNLSSSSSGE